MHNYTFFSNPSDKGTIVPVEKSYLVGRIVLAIKKTLALRQQLNTNTKPC